MPRGILTLSLMILGLTLAYSCGADVTDKAPGKPKKQALADPASIAAIQVLVEPVNGGQVTGVGFRATVFKNAIRWNLAGSAVNSPVGDTPPTMTFVLQGDSNSINDAMAVISKGPSGIAPGSFKLTPTDIAVDTSLTKFEVQNWTSQTRKITNPYNLFYYVDPSQKAPILDEDGAKVCYRQILFYCVTDPADRAKIDKPAKVTEED